MDKRKNNGGARTGAGNKKLFDERTTITFSIEKEQKALIKQKFGAKINKLFHNFINEILTK